MTFPCREGKFIATCSDKTDLIVWNIKGDVLERIGEQLILVEQKRFQFWYYCQSSIIVGLQTRCTT